MTRPSEEWVRDTVDRAAEVYETAAATKGVSYAVVLRYGATVSTTISTLHRNRMPPELIEHISRDLFELLGHFARERGVDLGSPEVCEEFMRTVLLMGPVLLDPR